VSSDQGTWVITSFAVANGVSVPLTGWLMQRFGVVRTFVMSVALFTIASLLCGLAWSLPSLDRVSCPAGCRVGTDDSRQPGAAHQRVRAAQAQHRADHLVGDDPGRARRRAGAGRLHLGQLRLAVDFS
jgi:hypothetical protein